MPLEEVKKEQKEHVPVEAGGQPEMNAMKIELNPPDKQTELYYLRTMERGLSKLDHTSSDEVYNQKVNALQQSYDDVRIYLENLEHDTLIGPSLEEAFIQRQIQHK